MQQQFRLSEFSSFFLSQSGGLFYHALNMNMVCVEDHSGFRMNGEYILLDDESELYIELKQKELIVASDKGDVENLEKARQEIRDPYISTAYFFITKNCNLACKYCFEKQAETENSNEGIMSCQTVDAGLQFFSQLICLQPERFNEKKTIIFYGGEPFHNKKTLCYAVESVDREIKKGNLPENTRMIIVTNGTLLNDKDIQFIKDHDVTLTFSLDGDRKASVNRVYPDMKTLAWRKASDIFRRCKEVGINLNVACTLTPQTIGRKQEVLDYFIHTIKADNIGFNVILDNDMIQLGEEYDNEAADFVASAYQILTDAGITENRTQRRLQVFNQKHPCLFDCNAAGGRQIAIAPNGDVGICHEHIMDKKHFVTNIYSDFNPAESPVYQQWQKRSPLYMEECRKCPAIGICGGGCVINTERKYGTIDRPDPRFCKQTLAILKKVILENIN